MARTTITARAPLGHYPVTPLTAGAAAVVWTDAADPTDRETPLIDGKTFVLAHNSEAATARTVTITSTRDSLQRLGSIVDYSVAAGSTVMFGPFRSNGWQNAGKLDIDVSASTLLLAIITLP